MSAPAETERLLQLHDEFSCGRDRRLVVVQFATRWFVLEGFTTAPLATYAVHGPVLERSGLSTREGAVRAAMALHRAAGKAARLRMVSA